MNPPSSSADGEPDFSGPSVLVLVGQIDGKDHRWPLTAPVQTLGSSSRCDLSIQAPGISRSHARLFLEQEGGEWRVEDLGSKNGTRVDGRRIRQPTPIQVGSKLRVGTMDLELRALDGRELEIGLSFQLDGLDHRPAPAFSEAMDPTLPRTLTGASDPVAAGLLVSLVETLAALPSDPHRRGTQALAEICRLLGAQHARLLEVASASTPQDQWSVLAELAGRNSQAPEPEQPEQPADLRPQPAKAVEPSHWPLPAALTPWPQAAIAGCRNREVWAWSPYQEGGGLILTLGLTDPGGGLAHGGQEASTLEAAARVALAWLAHWRLSADTDRQSAGTPAAEAPAAGQPTGDKDVALPWPKGHVVSRAPAMIAAYRQTHSVAEIKTPVLILGETGVGKEHVARLLHDASGRQGPLVAINCAAIPEHLLEAELFGIAKGVATGVRARQGKFVEAQGGTLFLDEIGDLPLALQAKLLRVLQEEEVQPLGGDTFSLDVRLLSATHAELRQRVEDGSFRRDLFYRLAGFEILLPALRQRAEDFPALVQEFAARTCRQAKKSVRGISVAAWSRLRAYHWPGNIRELEHEIRRAVLLCADGATIDSSMLSPIVGQTPTAGPADDSDLGDEGLDSRLQTIEKRLIEAALKATRGNQTRAAKKLAVSRNGLLHRMKKLAIDSDSFRDG